MNLPTYITGSMQSQAYRTLREHVYTVLEQYELTPTYWSMLGSIIEAKDGVRQVEIARELHVKAPLITAMAKHLEDRNIVQIVQNQFDARAKLLALTPEGKKLIKQIETDLHSHLQQLLTGLTEDDMKTYHKVLTTIVANDAAIAKK
ncbi:MAG: MarR family transcriptional regulator [Patescibacteria group bacterium]|nr:MarR family transcriptional regulator [Patescibacteria group bacterium]